MEPTLGIEPHEDRNYLWPPCKTLLGNYSLAFISCYSFAVIGIKTIKDLKKIENNLEDLESENNNGNLIKILDKNQIQKISDQLKEIK